MEDRSIPVDETLAIQYHSTNVCYIYVFYVIIIIEINYLKHILISIVMYLDVIPDNNRRCHTFVRINTNLVIVLLITFYSKIL